MTAQQKATRELGGVGVASKQHCANSIPRGIDALLSRLDRVKRTGPNTWLASCPTRDDKHPSMTIKELDDGRILIHDFGGDSTAEILDAIGLTFDSLFPESIHTTAPGKRERRPFPAADILRAIAFEALVVGCAASAMLAGQAFTQDDRDRLHLAVGRIQAALDAGGISHE